MRILLVTDSMDLGGAETHILTLATALAHAGETVEVCSAGGRLTARLAHAGIVHHTLPFRQRTPLGVLRCVLGLAKLFKNQYHVVHVHARYPAFLCALLHKRTQRFVTTCHAAYPPSILDHLPLHGQHVFAVSGDLRARLLADGKLSPQSVSVLYNAVYTPTDLPNRQTCEAILGLPPSAHRILAVHRMDRDTIYPAKRLLAVLPALRARYSDAQLVLVGDGNALEELTALAGEGAISVGGVTDTTPYYACADVLVGVSRSALEAMAQGVPVILAGTAGFAGLLTKENFTSAMACNLTCRGAQPLTDIDLERSLFGVFAFTPQERKQIAEFGKTMVERYYAPARMAETTRRWYAWLQPPAKRNHTLFVGYFGSDNLGDDAMLLAERTLASAPVACLAAKPRRARRTYGIPCYGKYNPITVCACLARSKQVVFGGGSLLQNKTSWRSLAYYAAVFLLAGLFGCRRVILANGLGPLVGGWAQTQAKKMLTKAEKVALRDEQSVAYARALGVTRPISLCADPALLITPTNPMVSLPEGCTLVCLRKNPHPAAIKSILAHAQTAPVVFVALQPCDYACSKETAEMCGGEVLPPLTAAELRGILASGKVRKVVTMRYHLALFAMAENLPTLMVGDDPKLAGLAAATSAPPPVPTCALTARHMAHIPPPAKKPMADPEVLAELLK